MKTRFLVPLIVLSLNLPAAEVSSGDTFQEVRAAMGAPRGQVQRGDRHLLYYDRGEIELQGGVVSRVELLTLEDYTDLEAKRTATARRDLEAQEVRRVQMSAEGEKLMANKLADPSFRAAPLAYQVAFWEDFSRRYPDVPSLEQLTIARLRYAENMEANRTKAEQAERLAQLEDRLLEAEARAAQTESGYYHTRSYGYSRGYGGSGHHPFNLMPGAYYYFDTLQSPAASPGIYNRPYGDQSSNYSRTSYDNCRLNDRPVNVRSDMGGRGNHVSHSSPKSHGQARF